MTAKIEEFLPPVELRPFVEHFWQGNFNTFQLQNIRQKVVPNGFVELIIHLTDLHCDLLKLNTWTQSPDYTIIGLYTQPYEVQFQDLVQVFGIRFKPEGIYNIFGVPAAEFSENYGDMERVLSRDFREYCLRLREHREIEQRLILTQNFLRKNLQKKNVELSYLNHAAEIIRKSGGSERIEQMPDKVYISLRQLEREFKKIIGVTPKQYMRIARMNKVHRLLEDGRSLKFTNLAFECGYADQAHFIRDFKTFTGVKPTLFLNKRELFIVNPLEGSSLIEHEEISV